MAAPARPEKILEELHELWVSLGRRGADSESGVLRACAMTLIVATEEQGNASAISETLAELMREHPSRAIVLCVRPVDQPLLEARVSAQCWLPMGQRRQICSEQIEITASPASLEDVPAVMVALTAPDLPVVLWCRSARLSESPGIRQLSRLAGKFILDTSQYDDPRPILSDLAAAARSGRVVADLSWTRLTGWRETIAQVFESQVCHARRKQISELRVLHSGRAVSVGACYMAAWLAGALGWEPHDSRLRFETVPGDEPGDLHGVRLAAPELTILVARRDRAELEVKVNGLLHRTFLPARSESALLGEELSIAGRDSVYEQTLAAAERIAHAILS